MEGHMNEAQVLREKNLHEIRVTNRKTMTVEGVKDVIGFDESTVQLTTFGGDMTVEGSDLHVKMLDVERGVVSLEGKIDGIFYAEPTSNEKRSFWERLVK